MFGQNRDQTCQTCWRQLPFGYKFLFLFTIAYNVLSMFLQFLITTFYFDGYLVVQQFQLWRLLIPYFPAGQMPMSVLNILINFLWLLSIFPPLEKKLSTSYIIVQTFLQNILVNLVLTLISIFVYYLFSINPEQFRIINYGLFPMCMIFVWAQAAQNPDQHTTFCCMPCLIPMKWIPVIILAFCLFMAPGIFLPLLTAFLLGYLQFMHLKRRLIKLPMKVYRKIDTILPKSITDRPDYVRVQNVQSNLKFQCTGLGGSVGGSGMNPFSRNQNANRDNQVIQQQNKVQVMGKGVSIGGGSSNNPQNFRGFWAQKAQEIQIQPVPQKMISQQQQQQRQQQKQQNDNYMNLSNSSHLQLNQHSPADTEEQLQQKDEKKLAKENLI